MTAVVMQTSRRRLRHRRSRKTTLVPACWVAFIRRVRRWVSRMWLRPPPPPPLRTRAASLAPATAASALVRVVAD